MDGLVSLILDQLVALSPFMGGLILLWLLYVLNRRWRKNQINLPIAQFLTWLLLVLLGSIVCASVSAGSGYLVDRLIGNPGDGLALVGALLGGITGSAIGWAVQRRSTL
jgi:hypothetical protein